MLFRKKLLDLLRIVEYVVESEINFKLGVNSRVSRIEDRDE
jgi:hypothetical protein